jgi:hypothetical protein
MAKHVATKVSAKRKKKLQKLFQFRKDQKEKTFCSEAPFSNLALR